jgi:hypothetical protein
MRKLSLILGLAGSFLVWAAPAAATHGVHTGATVTWSGGHGFTSFGHRPGAVVIISSRRDVGVHAGFGRFGPGHKFGHSRGFGQFKHPGFAGFGQFRHPGVARFPHHQPHFGAPAFRFHGSAGQPFGHFRQPVPHFRPGTGVMTLHGRVPVR